MTIGIPKELKAQEARVGITPSGAQALIANGHKVWIETKAGELSGFVDEAYKNVGCQIAENIQQVYQRAQMILKVKEPIEKEYSLIRKDHTLFTYFHFASNKELTKAMIDSKAACIAYETVEENGRLPLLIPMSEVAGRMATQQGAKYLEKPQLGFGILLGGVTGVPPANVMVLGGGIAGTEAARMAAGLGANVTIFDNNLDKLRLLNDIMPPNVTPIYSTHLSIQQEIKRAHLIIGTVLIPGARTPKLVTKDMLSQMLPGTVLIDVAIDQGGCFETSEPTTHQDPIRVKQGIIHYAVPNMPGAVPNTSTTALTNATLRYALEIANQGWENASKNNPAIAKGLNIVDGQIVYKPVLEAYNS
ncbi:MAG: alanine dehydrogenase [Flavobacteriaceae bacterium]|nr:alanine dehydrogenase [Flavobacteriaceae bacterium]